eukprot:Skav214994  [mRNA]  locus=scaffold508:733510:734352:- [translate_table: standard]
MWQVLYLQFTQAMPFVHSVHKVASHCDPHDQQTEIDMWAVRGNQAADHAATRARWLLPSEFWQVWNKVKTHQEHYRAIAHELHSMFADIGARVLQARTVVREPAPAGHQLQFQQDMDAALLHASHLSLDELPETYQYPEATAILRWLQSHRDQKAPVRWISFHQALLLFQRYSGHIGPMPLSRRRGPTWQTRHVDDDYEHSQQVQWFGRYLAGICRDLGGLGVEQRRPPSHTIAFWCGTFSLPVTEEALNQVDDHFRHHCRTLPARKVMDLNLTPPFLSV